MFFSQNAGVTSVPRSITSPRARVIVPSTSASLKEPSVVVPASNRISSVPEHSLPRGLSVFASNVPPAGSEIEIFPSRASFSTLQNALSVLGSTAAAAARAAPPGRTTISSSRAKLPLAVVAVIRTA